MSSGIKWSSSPSLDKWFPEELMEEMVAAHPPTDFGKYRAPQPAGGMKASRFPGLDLWEDGHLIHEHGEGLRFHADGGVKQLHFTPNTQERALLGITEGGE